MEVKDALTLGATNLKYLEGSYNYVDWSIQVQTYLMAKDLWDTIEATTKPPKQEDDEAAFKAWSDKNYMALRVIKNSCRPNTFSEIEKISNAKDAWNTLAEKYLPEDTSSDVLQVLNKDNYEDWSVQVKNRLMAHDLWDIVEETNKPRLKDDDTVFHAWSKKNSIALNVIKNSCELDTLFEIWEISSANLAWNTLKKKCLLKNTSSDVLQALEKDNYANWSVQVKDHLMAHDLWDIVEKTNKPSRQENDEVAFKAWSKKNFTALHVIQTSCGTDAFSTIKKIRTAKTAWNTLAEWNQINAIQKAAQNTNHEAFKESFQEVVRSGNWNAVEEFIERHPGSAGLKITNYVGTALHVAVKAKHEHIVEKLVAIMSEQELEVTDDSGNTAVVYAIYGSKKLARYIYSRFLEEDLTPEKCKNGATLCCEAIYTKNLDIALELIERRPSLALARDKRDRNPLYALVSSPFAFPSENRMVFWKRWIYKCIYIQPTRAIKEIRLDINQSEEKRQSDPVKILGSGEDEGSEFTRHCSKLKLDTWMNKLGN